MPDLYVSDVEDAVEVAVEIQRNGDANWFRGQLDSSWPLRPRLERVPVSAREVALEQIASFEQWVEQTPGLEALAASSEQKLAVAGHYGLPTPFLDFTTEPTVAAFFASHGEQAPPSGQSCIVCLETNSARAQWNRLPADGRPECITLDVPNLWRLEAQKGVFVFCPLPDLDGPFRLQRILFPFRGRIARPRLEEIYPERSPLETLLAQFFAREDLRARSDKLAQVAVEEGLVMIGTGTVDYDASFFETVPVYLESWRPEQLEEWVTIGRELWHGSNASSVVLEFSIDDDPREIGARAAERALQWLGEGPDRRGEIVAWRFRIRGDAVATDAATSLGVQLQKTWDGLRRLPYTDRELAAAVAACVSLSLWLQRLPQAQDEELAALAFGDRTCRLEFGAVDGSYNRGWVRRDDLMACIRDDFLELIAEDWRERAAQLMREGNPVLLTWASAQRLLEFDRVAALFPTQLVPGQVVLRPGKPVFYTPARLNTFGV